MFCNYLTGFYLFLVFKISLVFVEIEHYSGSLQPCFFFFLIVFVQKENNKKMNS